MSDESIPPLIRQQQLIGEVGEILRHEREGSAAASLRYDHLALYGYAEHLVYLGFSDGTTKPQLPPRSLHSLMRTLRDVMYQPGAGTWFSAAVSVTAQGEASADFNYDHEPEWETGIDPVLYVQDLEKYPRDSANTPAWLRQRLAEAPSSTN